MENQRKARDVLGEMFAENDGRAEAERELALGRQRALAKAATLLAARECPSELIEWGRIWGIPTLAEYTWQAGFLAGMRAAEMDAITTKPT